jgi:dihydroxy-acid dehydratase
MPEMYFATAIIAADAALSTTTAVVTDGRYSGAAKGPAVGHVTPEAMDGGPLALVEDGDLIRLDAAARRLDLLVDEAELARRRTRWSPPPKPARGYSRLYVDHVTQAGLGCDFDFLAGTGEH